MLSSANFGVKQSFEKLSAFWRTARWCISQMGGTAGPIPQEEPVFIFTIHRSGGTLLMRMLNCHPALVIWGEHGGFINNLADADLTMRSLSDWLPVRSDEEIEEYVAFGEHWQRSFHPLMNPFASSDFARWCHDLLTEVFSRGLGQGQRWGFKEIRYHRPSVATFLKRLFPAAKFIFLFRDPVELCVHILVEWSLTEVLARGGGNDRESLRQVVGDCLYAILAKQAYFDKIKSALPSKCICTRYETLVEFPETEVTRLFGFLDLPLQEDVRARVKTVIASVAGATVKNPAAHHPVINEQEIRRACDDLLDGIATRIRTEAIDTERLAGLAGKGKFSFIVCEGAADVKLQIAP
jgi:hypothetical protein